MTIRRVLSRDGGFNTKLQYQRCNKGGAGCLAQAPLVIYINFGAKTILIFDRTKQLPYLNTDCGINYLKLKGTRTLKAKGRKERRKDN
jgi:hypothetical protein